MLTSSERQFFDDPLLNEVRMGFPVRHKEAWDSAINEYLKGDWANAKHLMEECLELLPTDGAAKGLYAFMEKHNFKAPNEWEGFRMHKE